MSELSYLEKLLDGVEVEWVPVSELFQIKNGYTPSKSKKEFWENGTIPWFRLEDVRVNGRELGNDSNLLIVFYVQIMPDDLVMQLHRF
ncbi:restriction endonuclease subunit S [Escherichia coli]|uniref:restriction endonuclease subunit S n=1 Tax=Escherichia coli TaxID=562 RepID=UPI002078C744|nr:restriction endonuclease subunit S [Escherichia coli]